MSSTTKESLFTHALSMGEGMRKRELERIARKVEDLSDHFESMSDEELGGMTEYFRERHERGEELDELLPEAFAAVREASGRTLGMRHFPVQLMGGVVLHRGMIAEMRTGEGKTLVAPLAAYLNAIAGKGVHVVTVNDYLAKRDSEWMGRVYGFLGMSVGCLQNDMDPGERRGEYLPDVTYGTNSEFGFDYLRDNMVGSPDQRMQRGHSFAIVDEADSILIDEARTPLIISGIDPTPVERYRQFARAVEGLSEDDVSVDEAKHTVYATEEGLDKIEDILGLEVYADASGLLANHLRQALVARFLFHRDDQYVVAEGKVKIVDEFTGRILKGRRYSEGLHQAIEAKEGVEIRYESMTMATVTLQNYFRLYDKLSGMTGTAKSADAELRETYDTPVVTIPTNRPVIREDREDYVFLTRQDKLRAVADEVERRHEKGQPVLVGTTSVEASEELDRLMGKRGIPHQTLNAKDPGREAVIVANAGRVGAVTIATNMAGRGTDIILGGSYEGHLEEGLRQVRAQSSEGALPWQVEQAEEYARTQMRRQGDLVRNLGGLLVIGTERHDSRRIDDQLRGRSGRQGDPGESRFYLSLEDRLLRLYGKGRLDAMTKVMKKVGWGEGEPAEDRRISAQVTKAQEKVESIHHGMRKQVLDYDDVMDKHRRAVYDERDAILDGADIEGRVTGHGLIAGHAVDIIDAIVEETCGGARRKGERDVDGLNAWVSDMTGDESFDAEKLGEGAGVDELADDIEDVFAERWDAQREAMGEEAFRELCRQVLLRSLDQHWVDHLVDMDHLKQGMGLRGLAQRDPLVEYKREAFDSFRDLVREIYADFLRIMLRLKVEGGVKADEVVPEEENPFREENLSYSRSGESTIQDDSDLSAMADIAGNVDIEADD
ncbi:preprotein translocase subunit SecA [Olsenella sp. oral taxon 807]|uniref:preprotein translocase subunit SecA n=1 Tax=Olsenella sp. oral taxon 807 TaxID=712411 RepID=UPI00067CEB1A|nr:preprotein translocase subunit SecA [Olsenella sp. oral taxon 807]